MPTTPGIVGPERFDLMLPGERRMAVWAVGRVMKVQEGRAGAVQLVAGAYVVLAAFWGSIGGMVGLVGIGLLFANIPAGYIVLIVAFLPLAVSAMRQIQARRSRARGDP
jgi:hypothetical protein